jgi:hypothetical protein
LLFFAASTTVAFGREKKEPGRRMGRYAGAPIVLTASLTESLDHAAQWRRSAGWPWMIAGLVAVLCLLWGGRRVARGVNEHVWRAIEECGSAIAPLLLFALLWLIVDPPPRPNGQAGPAWKVRMIPPA